MTADPRDGWLRHKVAEADSGLTVQQVVTEKLSVSRRMIQRLTRTRGITINSRAAFLGRKVRTGDVVAVRVRERSIPFRVEPTSASVPLSILHEDVDVLVVDKPAGILVHPSSERHTGTLAHAVAEHMKSQGLPPTARPIHRLDKGSSGAVIFAKSAYAHQHIDRQQRAGELRREYTVVAKGGMEGEGTIDLPIGRIRGRPNLREVRADGDTAISRYVVMETLPGATLLRMSLETGRTHQIRVHLSHLSHPVLGDREYGGSSALIGRPALHAASVSFTSPRSSQELTIGSPLPRDIADLIESLRGDPPLPTHA